MSLTDTLEKTGLDHLSATIYVTLVGQGELQVPQIAEYTDLSRASVYEALNQLIAGEYVDYRKSGRNAYYKAVHPDKLYDLIEQKKRETRLLEDDMKDTIKTLVGTFNLSNNKPGVRFFEGEDGIKEVLNDTLVDNPQRQLRTFSDVAGYATYLSEWNTTYYAKKRKELGIFEQVIIPDHPKALDYMKNYTGDDVTDIIFIDHELFPFKTEVNIYSNKVSFVTFSDTVHIGVIIENKEIYETILSIFNFCWKIGKKYNPTSQPSWMSKYNKKAPIEPAGQS